MRRKVPVSFILFLILIIVISIFIENHYKHEYLGGQFALQYLHDRKNKFITSNIEISNMISQNPSSCIANKFYNDKLKKALNPGLIESNLFNPLFLSANFIHSDYYYNYNMREFDTKIRVPYVYENIKDYEFSHIFNWNKCDVELYENLLASDTSLKFNISKLHEDSNKFNSTRNNFDTSIYNQVPLECILNDSRYIELNRESIDNITDIGIKNTVKLNKYYDDKFEEKLFTKENTDYIWFFQYYAKIFAYNIYISQYSSQEQREKVIANKLKYATDIIANIKNQHLICFPLTAEYGLYTTLVYDPRFGIIIACKGSEGDNEWANNFDKDGVATRIVINNYHNILNAINYIQYKYYNEYKEYIENIAFTGHSLGGAISQQLAALFVNNQYHGELTAQFKNMHLITFNSAGLTPFIRNMSLEFIKNNRTQGIDNTLNIYTMTVRRRHDAVHQTGHVVFQSMDIYTRDQVSKYYHTPKDREMTSEVYMSTISPMRVSMHIKPKQQDGSLSYQLVVPSTNKIPFIGPNQDIYKWPEDKNLNHILLLFDYDKYYDVVASNIEEQKPGVTRRVVRYIKEFTPNVLEIIKNIMKGSFTFNMIGTVLKYIAYNIAEISGKYALESHTRHFLIKDHHLYMYYNSKNLDMNNIELYRMCLEMNKYKIQYIPEILRLSNVASYVMEYDEDNQKQV